MNERESPLLIALEELTKPVRTKVLQDGAVKPTVIELPPLLAQLEEAIRGSMVGIGGSGSLAHLRSMLDGDALYRFATISSTIRDWAHMVGAKVEKEDPSATLTNWYRASTAKETTVDQDKFYIKQMGKWAREITSKLNPKRTQYLTDDCPFCGADTWWNPSDKQQYRHPLINQFPTDSEDPVNDSIAICRACGDSWGARELSRQIELVAEAQRAVNE